jgi:hypothetical protein
VVALTERKSPPPPKRQAGSRPLLYTEWNVSSNPRFPCQDEPFAAAFVIAWSDGGYTTNLPLEDVASGNAWIAHTYDGEPLDKIMIQTTEKPEPKTARRAEARREGKVNAKRPTKLRK